MRYSIGLIALALLFLQGCTTTAELKKARVRNQERSVTYSPLSGKSYRYPPLTESQEEEPRARLKWEEVSNSPFSLESKTILINPGRIAAAASQREKQPGVVYNPFTGETTVTQ